MTWIYQGEELDQVPEGAVGFVYCITCTLNGKKYIGKKKFHSMTAKMVKGKRKRTKVESKWRSYFGSNDELLADVKAHGAEHFTREILRMCYSLGEMSYYEAKYQFTSGVLENSELWYNKWIACKVHLVHLNAAKKVRDSLSITT